MSWRADSRGNCVSVSRVMTYLMERRIAGSPTTFEKHSAAAATQISVEFHQLAALAFVSHPLAFTRVPAARPMEEEEKIAPFGGVFMVERFDSGARAFQQRPVLGQSFRTPHRPNRSARAKCKCGSRFAR